ncbi:MAG: FtsX-like permease family protein [Candidatus Magasanikbacteria bacterium]|nr:FtsX-like permease family protein [Candidatus Magasanikbacteria bacterium]
MLSFLRVIKFAIEDLYRNISLSFMTVLILVLMLLSINALIIVRVLTQEAALTVKDQINVSIYFSEDATEDEIKEVSEYVSSAPEVVQVTYFSREEVLEKFREQHKENTDVLAALEELGENPLGPTIVVKTREPGDYQKIIKSLNVPEYENIIESKTFADTEKAIERIDTITTQVERFSIALSGLFGIIAFLIIFNTIRVSVYTQRIEISIKKLVGATDWFVRGPYLINALIFSAVSIIVTYLLVVAAAGFLDPFVSVIFNKYSLLTDYFTSNIMLVFGIEFIGVLVLTVFTSLLAMRRYLRV